MTTYGITPQGFVVKPLDAIKSDLEDELKAIFGNNINLLPQSFYGQFVGVMAERLSELWDLAEAIYESQYPDSASGASLDNVAAITGTVRLAATKTIVSEVLIGTNGTVVGAGKTVSVTGSGTKFDTLASATIATLAAWAGTTSYAVGDLKTNAGNVYVVITAGTSAGSGGPTTTAADITDGTVHWKYLGAGTAAVRVNCQAEDTGPVVAPAGTLTTIVTPVAGWTIAINPLDGAVGRDVETDADYRLRRNQELRLGGKSTVETIRDEVLDVSGVTACLVFENTTDSTNGDGLPPHSFQVVALGGADADVAAAIWVSKPAGIATYGATTITITDSQGQTHSINFDRPTEKDVWIIVLGTKDATTYPSDGDAQIKQKLVDFSNGATPPFGDGYQIGDDVIDSALYAPVFEVSGVVDITMIQIGFSSPPTTNANLVIGTRELAKFDTSRITVTLT